MTTKWTVEKIMAVARDYQPACVLFAAADLDIFTSLKAKPLTAKVLAGKLKSDQRATAVLLDALAAMGFLRKRDIKYHVPRTVAALLSENAPNSVLPMVRHQSNCLRRWVQLPEVTKTGTPARRSPSIRGSAADEAAFIAAMNTVSGPIAKEIIQKLKSLRFRHLLDIGGASGTWTIAFLHAFPRTTASLFDLPEVIPMAKRRVADAGLTRRVKFIPGDFYIDDLPPGADFAWLSAIAHQNSGKQNRQLFVKIYKVLAPTGVLVVRDIVMDESRTTPEAGAMFAINMLVATPAGGTYTFSEYRKDLLAAGFAKIALIHKDEGMKSLILASKA
jgi:predicted O-methyltransferase YrrM